MRKHKLEMDTWYIRDYNHSIVTEVEGKENYRDPSEQIVTNLLHAVN